MPDRSPDAAADPQTLVRDTIRQGAAEFAAQVLLLVRSLVAARLLLPSAYGVWQGLMQIVLLGRLSHLGALDALRRDVPIARGAGEPSRAATVRANAYGVCIAAVAPIALGCAIGAAALFLSGDRKDLAAALAATSAVALLQQLWLFALADTVSANALGRAAAAGLAPAAASAALAVPLIRALGVTGFALAVAGGFAAGLAVTYGAVRPAVAWFRPRLRIAEAMALIRTGFPIEIVAIATSFLRNIDKLLILAFAGTTAAGLYGIGDTLATFVSVVPVAAGFVAAPRAMERFGRAGGEPGGLRDALTQPLDLLSRTMPAIAGSAAVLAEVAIRLALPPSYEEAIPAAKVLALTGLAVPLTRLPMIAIVALERQKIAAYLTFAFVVLAGIVDAALLAAGLGIVAVASASVAIAASHGIVLGTYAYRLAGPPGHGLLGAARSILPPLLRLGYGGVAVVAVELAGAWVPLPGGVAGRLALVLALTLPLAAPLLGRVSRARSS